jgi:hypothetical protein
MTELIKTWKVTIEGCPAYISMLSEDWRRIIAEDINAEFNKVLEICEPIRALLLSCEDTKGKYNTFIEMVEQLKKD